MKDRILERFSKPVSNVKTKPTKAWSVSKNSIERLNISVAKKLKQNEIEMRASMFDVEEKIVK